MKNKFFLLIIICVICVTSSVYAVVKYQANQIAYNNTTVDEALDDLYSMRSGTKVVGRGDLAFDSSDTTPTKVTAISSENSNLSINNNTYTVKKRGMYIIIGIVGSNEASTNGSSFSAHTKIYINNSEISGKASQSYSIYGVRHWELNLNVGDTIDIYAYGDGGNYKKRAVYYILSN